MRFLRTVILGLVACGGGGASVDGSVDGKPADTMVVDAAASTTVTLSIRVNNVLANAAFVAGQDGNGAWQPLIGTSGVYHLTVSGTRFGLVWVCDYTSMWSMVYGMQATIADGTELAGQCPAAVSAGTLTLSGTVTGLATGGHAYVTSGFGRATVNQDGGSYSWPVAPATYDLLGARYTSANVIDRFILNRDVMISQNTQTSFNFTSSGVDPEPHTVTTSGTLTNSSIRGVFISDRGTRLPIDSAMTASTTIHMVPSSKLLGNDLHRLDINSDDGAHFLSTIRYFRAESDQSYTLPSPWDSPATTVALQPYLRVTATFAPTTSRMYWLDVYCSQNTTIREWSMYATPSWLGQGTSLSYTFPDLSAVPGWASRWQIDPSSLSSCFTMMNALTGTANTLDFVLRTFYQPVASDDGREITSTAKYGTL